MPNYKFTCTHCGKSFEQDLPEVKECPFCFWTSSVKRDDELDAENKAAAGAREKKRDTGIRVLFPAVSGFFRWVLLIGIFAGAVFLGVRLYPGWRADEAPVSIRGDQKAIPGETGKKAKTQVPVTPEELSEADGKVLLRELSSSPEPSEAEMIVLARNVQFSTGWSERLPSPAWTLSQYEQLIADQERFYKITLPRSYKKNLRSLFEEKYLAGAEAFGKGDLLPARDLWIESLVFPLYSTNIQKHRGVVLTMLRSFINDTLSKIAALNYSLAEREGRVRERSAAEAYGALLRLIQEKQWSEALKRIDQKKPAPPPYPLSITKVDQDIQRTLAGLMEPAPVSTADFLAMRDDLARKKDILEDLSEENYRKSLTLHREGIVKIREGDYPGAIKVLSGIRGPEVLRSDAQAKLALLQKMTGADAPGEAR